MAFLSIHHLPGDPDELMTRKTRHMDPVVIRIAPAYGAILSVTARADDGLVTVNLWQSAQGASEFTARDEIQAAQRESGLPMPDRFERYNNVQVQQYAPTPVVGALPG